MDKKRKEMKDALINIDLIRVKELVGHGISLNNNESIEYIEYVVVPALKMVGESWEKGEISLSQMYMAAKLTENLFHQSLESPNQKSEKNPVGGIAICSLEDYHGLGKNIIRMALNVYGFHVIDYGVGIEVDELIQKMVHDNVRIILVSTLMLNSALRVKTLRANLVDLGFLDKIIIVGGAPFNFDMNLWKYVNADYYSFNISNTVNILNKILEDAK